MSAATALPRAKAQSVVASAHPDDKDNHSTVENKKVVHDAKLATETPRAVFPPEKHSPLTDKPLVSLAQEEVPSASHSSPATTSTPHHLNSDARHATWSEVSEQLDGVLRALGQLRQLQQRSRRVSRLELKNLRVAYTFAIGERDCVLATSSNTNNNSNNTSSSTVTQKEELDAHDAKSHATTSHHVNSSNISHNKSSASTSSIQSINSSITPAMVSALNDKAAAAERMLVQLEAYVHGNPNSDTFESTDHEKFISWRSIIHTPSERRMQSLIVSIFMFFTAIPICVLITGLLLYCRYTAPFMIIYLVYMYTIGHVRHPCRRDINFAHLRMWQYYADYFPVRLVLPRHARRRFSPKKNYLFIYHPHGVHSFGAICNFLVDTRDLWGQLPGIVTHIQTLRINFYVPFWRSMLIRLGCGDASADCIRKTLRSGPGESVVLVVGGTEEALLTRPHTNNIVLNKRKGFIRIALQEGSPLVPIYAFGENDAYNIIDVEKKSFASHVIRVSKRLLGFSLPAIVGRGFFVQRFGIMPYRHPIVVVVSEPLEVPKIESPTQEDIDLWHDQYVARLRDLYNKHCSVYDLESTGLRITN